MSRSCISIALAAIILAAAPPVGAATRCVAKTASGTGPTEEVAKFQVYEAVLAATDQGAWASWMATGTTPGYKVGKPVYTCRRGVGLGVSCTGRATVCKT